MRSMRPPPSTESGPIRKNNPARPSASPTTTCAPGRVPPRPQPVEQHHAARHDADDQRRDAGRDPKLRPDQQRRYRTSSSSTPTIAVARHSARVGTAAPPKQARPRVEHGARDQEPRCRHEERRQRLDREQDREIRRAPDDVDDREREQHEPTRGCAAGRARHVGCRRCLVGPPHRPRPSCGASLGAVVMSSERSLAKASLAAAAACRTRGSMGWRSAILMRQRVARRRSNNMRCRNARRRLASGALAERTPGPRDRGPRSRRAWSRRTARGRHRRLGAADDRRSAARRARRRVPRVVDRAAVVRGHAARARRRRRAARETDEAGLRGRGPHGGRRDPRARLGLDRAALQARAHRRRDLGRRAARSPAALSQRPATRSRRRSGRISKAQP